MDPLIKKLRPTVVLLLAALVTLTSSAAASAATWIPGDLHVHSCYSHDVWCPGDDETPLEEFYLAGFNVTQRFAQASAAGLRFLAVTDHNGVRAATDPGFGRFGVTGVPGYEASFDGHAQMLGADHVYPAGARDAAGVNGAADSLRAAGGLLQINHPGDGASRLPQSCSDSEGYGWKYGFDVRPDTIEVINPTASVLVAERMWECWLERGERVAATGGSDTHLALTSPVQSVGMPTTWVHADNNDQASILRAMREGRTSVSRDTPALGGSPLEIEGDSDGDFRFESRVGDAVRRGRLLRVRGGSSATGSKAFLRVRANGRTIVDSLPYDSRIGAYFRAPSTPGWVRATIYAVPAANALLGDCRPELIKTPISLCPYDRTIVALTSPIYIR
ncbi:MAG: CehA/McbA family metallohydrolase [Thermoleophilaceae bacterium]|nr:CehA/McbA family metallohydrolase [Thermoleophilaceae bacterium]